MAITRITGRTNPLIVRIASLHEKKYRDRERMFLLEGSKLLVETLQSGITPAYIFTTERMLPFCLEALGIQKEEEAPAHLICLSEGAFEKISTEKAPQGVICVVDYLDKRHFFGTINKGNLSSLASGRLFALCSIRDPGNLGTIIRTAHAFGIDALLLSADCADLYNPRTVRSAMGTLLRQQIYVVNDLPDTLRLLAEEQGREVLGAMLDESARSLDECRVDKNTVFVVGNEGHGIDAATAAACTGSVIIPMAPESAESLNAAIAAAILLWRSFHT